MLKYINASTATIPDIPYIVILIQEGHYPQALMSIIVNVLDGWHRETSTMEHMHSYSLTVLIQHWMKALRWGPYLHSMVLWVPPPPSAKTKANSIKLTVFGPHWTHSFSKAFTPCHRNLQCTHTGRSLKWLTRRPASAHAGHHLTLNCWVNLSHPSSPLQEKARAFSLWGGGSYVGMDTVHSYTNWWTLHKQISIIILIGACMCT